jgi:branched-chain amino acid transport system substrate-binding protein
MDIEKSVSRREFLKMAGIAGATVGVAGGLGGLLAACGETAETSTTAGGAATSAGGTSTTAGAEAGRPVKIGVVSPQTGGLAMYGVVDKWWTEHAAKAVGDGIVLADGKQHPIELVVRDCQSDSNRAAQVAGDMIVNDKCDMILASGTPDTVDPTADTCEAMETPFLGSLSPWQTFYFGRKAPAEGFKWTYGFFLGSEQAMSVFIDCYNKVPNNKKVGMLFANDADAQGWLNAETGAPVIMKKNGYTMVLPSQYQPGAEDFTAQIAMFKKEGVDLLCGTNTPPDFTNFWKQAYQQGFQPKLASSGKCLGYPQTLEAIGEIGFGLLGEGNWHRTWPFKDSLTGMTCQQLADEYEASTGNQWTAAIIQYAKFEWAVDAFKRASNIEDKATVAEAIRGTKMETCGGPIDFTEAVDPAGKHPNPNVYKQPYCAVQWRKGTKSMFEPVIVGNAEAPMVTVQSDPEPMQYS